MRRSSQGSRSGKRDMAKCLLVTAIIFCCSILNVYIYMYGHHDQQQQPPRRHEEVAEAVTGHDGTAPHVVRGGGSGRLKEREGGQQHEQEPHRFSSQKGSHRHVKKNNYQKRKEEMADDIQEQKSNDDVVVVAEEMHHRRHEQHDDASGHHKNSEDGIDSINEAQGRGGHQSHHYAASHVHHDHHRSRKHHHVQHKQIHHNHQEQQDGTSDQDESGATGDAAEAARGDESESPSSPTVKPWKKEEIPKSYGMSAKAAVLEPVVIKRRAEKMNSHKKLAAGLSFIAIGDWGGPGRQPQRQVAKAMETMASTLGHTKEFPLDFVVSTGDNMYEDGVGSVNDIKFKRNFEKVYTHPTHQCRWYMSLGNHDHGAHGVLRNVEVQVNYTQLSDKWFLPSTHYTQRFEFVQNVAGVGDENEDVSGRQATSFSMEMFVLDTYDVSPRLTRMTERQLDWFAEVLEKSTADWKIVVGHRPLFSGGTKHGSSPYMQKHLLPLLKKYKVAAYLSGDDHDLQVLQTDGIQFLISGGGARAKNDLRKHGVKQTVFQAGVHGFMHLLVNASHMELGVFNKEAEMIFGGSYPRP